MPVVHNTSAAAASAFTEATGFDVSDILVDLYYWFDHSSKRKNLLVEYSGFCDEEWRQDIKYASTRWLSLAKCVTRALQKYESLKSSFFSEKSSQARFKRLQAAFQDPMTEVYVLFYQSALHIYLHSAQLVPSDGGTSDRSSESGASAVPAATRLQIYSSSYSESSHTRISLITSSGRKV